MSTAPDLELRLIWRKENTSSSCSLTNFLMRGYSGDSFFLNCANLFAFDVPSTVLFHWVLQVERKQEVFWIKKHKMNEKKD